MEGISMWAIYWVMQADTISGASVGFSVMLGMATAICALCTTHPDDDVSSGPKRWIKRVASAFIFCVLMAVFFPTTKTLLAMVGIPLGIQIAQGLELDTTAKRSVQLLNQYLEKELAPKAGGK